MSALDAALSSDAPQTGGKLLRIALWTAQALVAAMLIMAGFMKLTTPIDALSAMIPWTGQVSPGFVRSIGVVDLAGGLGLLLPALTRVQPRLTVLAALGCVALQVLAFGFHLSRGEYPVLPVNLVLALLSAFVLWGRGTNAPIRPRA